MANLFLKLSDQLTTQVPAIKWIDHDLGQLDFYQTRPPVLFPCVLIDMNNAQAAQKQQQMQLITLNFTLRLATDQYNPTAAVTPLSYKEAGLANYEIEFDIFKAINEWKADGLLYRSIYRSSFESEARQDPFRVRRITFSCEYIEKIT